MREVIEAIDGPLSLNVCMSDKRSCPRKDWCPAHSVWVQAQEALLSVLDAALISDLASGKHRGLPVLVGRKTGTGD
jgi:DNA-binding IscR family transcriptional regulator